MTVNWASPRMEYGASTGRLWFHCSQRGEGRDVIIERAVEVFPGGKARVCQPLG